VTRYQIGLEKRDACAGSWCHECALLCALHAVPMSHENSLFQVSRSCSGDSSYFLVNIERKSPKPAIFAAALPNFLFLSVPLPNAALPAAFKLAAAASCFTAAGGLLGTDAALLLLALTAACIDRYELEPLLGQERALVRRIACIHGDVRSHSA
jgi:hypothetical protein